MRISIERYKTDEGKDRWWFTCFRKFNNKQQFISAISVSDQDCWKGFIYLINPTSWITKFTRHQ